EARRRRRDPGVLEACDSRHEASLRLLLPSDTAESRRDRFGKRRGLSISAGLGAQISGPEGPGAVVEGRGLCGCRLPQSQRRDSRPALGQEVSQAVLFQLVFLHFVQKRLVGNLEGLGRLSLIPAIELEYLRNLRFFGRPAGPCRHLSKIPR